MSSNTTTTTTTILSLLHRRSCTIDRLRRFLRCIPTNISNTPLHIHTQSLQLPLRFHLKLWPYDTEMMDPMMRIGIPLLSFVVPGCNRARRGIDVRIRRRRVWRRIYRVCSSRCIGGGNHRHSVYQLVLAIVHRGTEVSQPLSVDVRPPPRTTMMRKGCTVR